MKPKLLFIALLFAFATTSAAQADTYLLGPYQAVGYGLTQAAAADQATSQMEAFLDQLSQSLPPGHFINGVTVESWEWDGLEFQISFTVWAWDVGA